MSKALGLAGVLLLVLAPGVGAQQDDPGSKDHPLLSRMPGFYIDSYETQEFDAHEFTVKEDQTVQVEGKKTVLAYCTKEGSRRVSELQILRNYVNAIKQAGGAVLWSNDRAGQCTARFASQGAEVWVFLRAYNQGDCYDLVFVEKQAMQQEVTAADMLAALNREGRIALYIQFDFAKADIKPESTPVIEQIVALMQGNAGLNVSVEGHTDNVGSAASNQTLSEQRAKAVVAAIVGQGISAGRLSAVGHGLAKPIADNSTEEGRAQNRRVELVKK